MKKSLLSVLFSVFAVFIFSQVVSVSIVNSADAAVTCEKTYTSCATACRDLKDGSVALACKTNAPNGTSCGTGMHCQSGNCVSICASNQGDPCTHSSNSYGHYEGTIGCNGYCSGGYWYGNSCSDHTSHSSCTGYYTSSGGCSCTRTCDESSCSPGNEGCSVYCPGTGNYASGTRYRSCYTESSTGCPYASYGSCNAQCCPSSGCTSNTSCTVANGTGTQYCSKDSGCTYGSLGACTITGCNAGYHLSGGACVSNTTTCPTGWSGNAVWSGTWSSGTWSYTGCYKACDCSLPAGAETVDCADPINYPNACYKTITKCLDTHYLSGGVCVTCPAGATCDGNDFTCNAPLLQSGATCVCPTGTSTTGDGGLLEGDGGCRCPTQGYDWDGAACAVCADGDRDCGCDLGYVADGSGGCRVGGCDAGYYQTPDLDCIACPDFENGATSPTLNEGDITSCYKVCPPQPAGWPNTAKDSFGKPATGNQEHCTIIDYPAQTNYSVESGGYPACEYTVQAEAGYRPQSNPGANPWCQLHMFNITYKMFNVTLEKPELWTDLQWPTSFDKFSMAVTPVSLPDGPGVSCTGSYFAGWYGSADYAGSVYTQVPEPILPNCTDCTDPVYHAKMLCEAGYHTAPGAPSFDPCNICDPDAITLAFAAPDKTSGAEPADVTCTYMGGCDLPNKNTLFKTGNQFSQWCTEQNGGGDCYSVGANLNSFAKGANGTTVTLYASWASTTIDCAAGTYFPGTGSVCVQCQAGSYCPGGICDVYGAICGISNCTAATGGEYANSAVGSNKIADCYKSCQPSNVCSNDGYTGGTQYYGGACQYVISNCATGYYKSTNQCVPCPNSGKTVGCNAGGIESCFLTCALPTVEHLQTITPTAAYDVNYSSALSGYPLCEFTISCQAPYNPFNNVGPYPVCALGDNIVYILNGGTASWTTPEYFNDSQLPIDVKNGRVPTRARSTFVGWYANPDFSGGEALSITTGGKYTLYARWECQQGYYAKTANSCEEVGIDYYSPNGDNNRYKCPDGFTTSSSISTQITSCYKDEYAPSLDADCDGGYRRATVLMSTLQPENCVNHTCAYDMSPVVNVNHADSTSLSELAPITGAAGKYYTGLGSSGNWATDLCQDVTDGYFSPSRTATRTECPVGYNGSDGTRGSHTNCYANCTQMPSVSNSTNVSAVNAKVYYTGTMYPACRYNVQCLYDGNDDTEQYCAKNNDTANPTCEYCGVCPDGMVCDPDPRDCPSGYRDGPGVDNMSECRKICESYDVSNGVMSPDTVYVNPYNQCTFTLHCGAGYKPNSAGTVCVVCAPGEICPCDPVVDPMCMDSCDSELWCCPGISGRCDPACLATGKPCYPDALMCLDIGTGIYKGYWPYSEMGSATASECFGNCPEIPLPWGYGTQKPIETSVYYDATCQYPADCRPGMNANCCSCNGNAPGCLPCGCTDETITCDKGFVLDRCECISETCENGSISSDGRRCRLCPPGAISNPDPIPNGFKAVQKKYTQITGYAPVWGDLNKSPSMSSSIGARDTKCLYCGAGLQPNALRNGCEKCPAGTYRTSDMLGLENCIDCPANSDCGDGTGVPSCHIGYVAEKQANGSILCVEMQASCDLGEYGYGTIDKKTGECILLGCLGDHHVSADGKRCESNRGECVTTGGTGYKDWNGSAYGDCVETSCFAGFQMTGGTCAECDRENALTYKTGTNCLIDTCRTGFHPESNNMLCVSDVMTCTMPNATIAQSIWSNGKYGACTPLACEYGYYIFNNACVRNIQACAIENGVGYQEWIGDSETGSWSACQVDYCNPGYSNDPSETDERSKPCGVCKNRISDLGVVAVASYSAGCEIASCLYSGELYALENNECVPICHDGDGDETGTMTWNSVTKKCEISCAPGYMKW